MVDNWNLIAKIKRGKNRLKIFLAINKPIMPSEIVNKIYKKPSNTYFNIVSRALKELVKLGLIKIKNPKEKTGRIYYLTKQGKQIASKLK